MASYLFFGSVADLRCCLFRDKAFVVRRILYGGRVSARIGTDRSNQFVYGIVCDRSCRQTPVS